jgi:NADH:ubiquinone oxidoreductase subunit E
MDTSDVDVIIERAGGDRSALISILEDIQDEYRWLPPETLRRVAEKLDVPLIDVFGTATFYRAFSLKPRGKHVVTMCQGTACHVRGAPRIRSELGRQLGIEPGDTTDDMQFTLEAVNCVGACALGPIVIVDGEFFGHMTPKKVQALVDDIRKRDEVEAKDAS